MDVKLSPSIIDDLKTKGLNQSEIAEMFGVTRQYVSWIKHTYGGVTLTPREIALKAWPWKVVVPYTEASVYRRLRDHGEYMATGGKGMSDDKLRRLRAFYQHLKDTDTVVEYAPAIPPEPGVSITGGWAYRPRVSDDGDLIIRVNEFTDLTDQGKAIWTMPPTTP